MAGDGESVYGGQTMKGTEESTVWKASSSQLTNFWILLGCLLLAAGVVAGGLFFPPVFALLAVPAGIALWRYLVVRCRVYELTTDRLRFYEGVFSRTIDEIELYRIKDSTIVQPFWIRIFGLGNVVLDTSDRSHPTATMFAISDATQVRELLRASVERLRDQKRVREVDFDGSGGENFDVELMS
ncbi:hypothetical protein BH23VER1_BH23VER1_19520 [soil metagenome]